MIYKSERTIHSLRVISLGRHFVSQGIEFSSSCNQFQTSMTTNRGKSEEHNKYKVKKDLTNIFVLRTVLSLKIPQNTSCASWNWLENKGFKAVWSTPWPPRGSNSLLDCSTGKYKLNERRKKIFIYYSKWRHSRFSKEVGGTGFNKNTKSMRRLTVTFFCFILLTLYFRQH